MAGLDPAIHVLLATKKDVDHRVTRPRRRSDASRFGRAACRKVGGPHDVGVYGRAVRHRRLGAPLVRFTMSNSQAKSAAALVGAAVAVVSPWHGGCSPSQDRGAERRVAPRKLHALAGVRVPLAKGTQRPSALRAAVFGHRGRASADRAFPALALGVAIITVANGSREGRSAPGASPGPPEGRACKARGAGRRTPLRHGLPPEAPSNERGYRNIYLGNIIMCKPRAPPTLLRSVDKPLIIHRPIRSDGTPAAKLPRPERSRLFENDLLRGRTALPGLLLGINCFANASRALRSRRPASSTPGAAR